MTKMSIMELFYSGTHVIFWVRSHDDNLSERQALQCIYALSGAENVFDVSTKQCGVNQWSFSVT